MHQFEMSCLKYHWPKIKGFVAIEDDWHPPSNAYHLRCLFTVGENYSLSNSILKNYYKPCRTSGPLSFKKDWNSRARPYSNKFQEVQNKKMEAHRKEKKDIFWYTNTCNVAKIYNSFAASSWILRISLFPFQLGKLLLAAWTGYLVSRQILMHSHWVRNNSHKMGYCSS